MDPIKQADAKVQAEVKQLETDADTVWVKDHIVWMIGLGCGIVGMIIGAAAVLARHL